MNHGFLKRNGVTWPEYISVHIATGDTRAAVIVSMDDDHFEIAAFTDELDCVAILRLPARFSDNYAIGQRFLTVNRYGSTNVAKDLIPGPGNTGRYTLFHPIIANFACSDQGALNERLQMIPHWEWDRAFTLGQEFRRLYPRVFRIGYPGLSRMEILSCGDRKQ